MRTQTPNRKASHSQSGQAMIFMIMAIIIIATVIIWNFDLHSILHLKSRTQNAGDAAALAAARWQGLTLNLIGDLNIMQAMAISINDQQTAAIINNAQARLCYAGPLLAMLAAQQAAKNNRIYANDNFNSRLLRHVELIYREYPLIFAEPYPGCWEEYGDALYDIARQGVAAAPDNTRYFVDYADYSHTLLRHDFYMAIAGRDWCWFFWHDLELLHTYSDYTCWPALPPCLAHGDRSNSEIFGLNISATSTMLGNGPRRATVEQLQEHRAIPDQRSIANTTSTWYVYNWTSWEALAPNNNFPIVPRQVKPEYDYAGADTVVRIIAPGERLTHNALQPNITWTAAAKPFGCLMADDTPIRPNTFNLVLPAFRNVRLIPVDAATGGNLSIYDLDWREHIENHLPLYMANGPSALDNNCWYCRGLSTWENDSFRQTGINWLNNTNNSCERVISGPSAPGGGARRGH